MMLLSTEKERICVDPGAIDDRHVSRSLCDLRALKRLLGSGRLDHSRFERIAKTACRRTRHIMWRFSFARVVSYEQVLRAGQLFEQIAVAVRKDALAQPKAGRDR